MSQHAACLRIGYFTIANPPTQTSYSRGAGERTSGPPVISASEALAKQCAAVPLARHSDQRSHVLFAVATVLRKHDILITPELETLFRKYDRPFDLWVSELHLSLLPGGVL